MNQQEQLIQRTAGEHAVALAAGEYSARELAEACLARAESLGNLGIFLRIGRERVLAQAEGSDRRRARGMALSHFDGIPVSVKDNILEKGEYATCGSRMLENFFAPYDATVIEKLRAAGLVLFGRTNMDEFAMGSSTENSAFGVARNPWDPARVPGGSSGGAAASVVGGAVPLAIGSDTGGSIRQPAAFCGCVGLKPTYGRVSRYGLVAFASSLDQIGPFARNVPDAARLLGILSGRDPRDATSHPEADIRKIEESPEILRNGDWRGVRVGLDLPEPGTPGFEADVIRAGERARDWLAARGAEIVPLRSRFRDYVIPLYYILAPAEASSNLSRYDGVRYGHRVEHPRDLIDLYIRSRTEGFGPEVKRRILLGTFVLSSGYYDAYYNSAQRARKLIQREFDAFFQKVDVILSPTSPTTAFPIGERAQSPLSMYQADLLTIGANLGGVPAISIPAGLDARGLPIGLQLMANHFEENKLLRIAASLAAAPGFDPGLPALTAPARKTAPVVREAPKKEKSPEIIKSNKKAKARTEKKVAGKGAEKVVKKSVASTAKKVAKKGTKKIIGKAAKKAVKKAAGKSGKKR